MDKFILRVTIAVALGVSFLNRPLFAGGSKVSMDGASGKQGAVQTNT